MKKHIVYLTLSSFILVAGCSNKEAANKTNFSAAINQYLDKKGELCLNLKKIPLDVSDYDVTQAKIFKNDSIALQAPALEKAGLLSSSAAQVDAVDYSGKPNGKKVNVTRYQLTDAGKKFYHERETTVIGLFETKKVMKGDICYGRMSLDKIVKWEGPMKLGDYQEAEVIYTYKIDDLADWAKNSDVAAAFPKVEQIVSGIGKTEEHEGVKLTSEGWEARALNSNY